MTLISVREIEPGMTIKLGDRPEPVLVLDSVTYWEAKVRIYLESGIEDLDPKSTVETVEQTPIDADEPVSITLTASEWDTLLGATYTEGPTGRNHQKRLLRGRVAAAVPGRHQRIATAHQAVEPRRPVLDLDLLAQRVREGMSWLEEQEQPDGAHITHFGMRTEVGDRFSLGVWPIPPSGKNGNAIMVVKIAEEAHAGTYPYWKFSAEEQEAITKTVRANARLAADTGAPQTSMSSPNPPTGGGHVSLSFALDVTVTPSLTASVNRRGRSSKPEDQIVLPAGWN